MASNLVIIYLFYVTDKMQVLCPITSTLCAQCPCIKCLQCWEYVLENSVTLGFAILRSWNKKKIEKDTAPWYFQFGFREDPILHHDINALIIEENKLKQTKPNQTNQ